MNLFNKNKGSNDNILEINELEKRKIVGFLI